MLVSETELVSPKREKEPEFSSEMKFRVGAPVTETSEFEPQLMKYLFGKV